MLFSESFRGHGHPGGDLRRLMNLWEVRQRFCGEPLDDIAGSVEGALERLRALDDLPAGSKILVTAGSRGIADIPTVLREVCGKLTARGFRVSILGAMGSHGGGTESGQRAVLESLGITPSAVGVPVITSCDVQRLGQTDRGLSVYCDPRAMEADGIVLVNRIKSHTTARGDIESGLVKKLVVGLGHQAGAESFHQCGPAAMSDELEAMARIVLGRVRLVGGIGLVENAVGSLHTIEGVPPAELFARERRLLALSKDLAPRLPFDEADVLVIREMGKNFSGTGVDTGVIGRYRVEGAADDQDPRIARICALDLSRASHGNATGVGLVDLITYRLAREIDPEPTYTNVLASTLTMRAMIPIIMRNDADAIGASLASAAIPPTRDPKLALIDNTRDLERLWISQGLRGALFGDVSIADDPIAVQFDASGTLRQP